MQDSSRPNSPYYPDKTPYYRARYHSAPHSPTGQNNKTTSTTELLSNPQVYHPAREEARNKSPIREESRNTSPLREESRSPMLHLSTQSLEIPADDSSWTDQLQMEVVSVSEDPAPLLNSAPPPRTFYDYEEFEPECDLGTSTHHVNVQGNYAMPKREEELLTPPPLPPRGKADDITLRGDNLFDPFHIGTTYVVLSRQNHGRFKYQTPLDPNSSAPPSPKPATPVRPKEQDEPVFIKPIAVNQVNSAPFSPAPHSLTSLRGSSRNLYIPKSLSGSVVSLTSLHRPDLDHTPSKLTTSPPARRVAPAPALPARNTPSKPMSPEQRRKFNRPVKEPTYREVAVDCGVDAPPVINTRKPSLQELQLEQKNPASREYHLQSIADEPRRREDSLPRAHSPHERSMSPHSQNSLRRNMPYVKMLGTEWKEMGQRLGYENSQIASFAMDYPDPGQALLDHWSRQPDSRLDDLLYHLKFMGLWKTADTLDKTFDNTNV